MKKIILFLMISLFAVNVSALDTCKDWQVEAGINELANLTYDLTYADDYLDRNGDFLPGYFKISFSNIPNGYYAEVSTETGEYFSYNSSDIVLSRGGVLPIKLYSNQCDGIIKSFEIKVPFYKQYCDLDKNCDENVWFDGTNTSDGSPKQESKSDNKISIKLVIILAVLIAIIVIFIVFAIRKRRFNAENL